MPPEIVVNGETVGYGLDGMLAALERMLGPQDAMPVIEALMQFCPRCGTKLTKPSEPAECGECGWKESDAA